MNSSRSSTDKLAAFVAANQPSRSRLEPHAVEVLTLHRAGYSGTQIARFLEEAQGVTISSRAVNAWIASHRGNDCHFSTDLPEASSAEKVAEASGGDGNQRERAENLLARLGIDEKKEGSK